MRPISARLAAKIKSDEKMQFKQKLLLYRRKWFIPSSWVLWKTINNIAVNDNLRSMRMLDIGGGSSVAWHGVFDLVIFSNGAKLQTWNASYTDRPGFNLIDSNGTIIWKFYTDAGSAPNKPKSDVQFPNQDFIVSSIVQALNFTGAAGVQLQKLTPNETGSYILEDEPIDISDAITQKGTNATISQQYDTQEANIWKVGNLALTLYNKDNRFWQGREDGLFPAPYTIYGSKLEYYVGDEFEEIEIIAATGLKDKISGQIFENAGTGEFLTGVDENGTYIQANGTQHIDLGLIPDNNTKIEVIFKATQEVTSGSNLIFGANYYLANKFWAYLGEVSIGNPDGTWEHRTNTLTFDFGNSGGTDYPKLDLNKKYKITLDKTGFYLDDIAINKYTMSTTPFTTDGNLMLFTLTEDSPDYARFKGRIYGVRVWQNDELVRDMYAVQAGENKKMVGDYVKQFTGYLTAMPNYRQDDALVDFQVLNRLDFLKTVSAETVSTSVINETPVADPAGQTKTYRTLNQAVGRFSRITQVFIDGSTRNLVEKTDYSLSDLNEYNLGALITLTSALLPGESLRVDYIYWFKGITIDETVRKLLDAAGIYSDMRIIDNVVFENQVRSLINLYAQPFSARFNYVLNGNIVQYQNNANSNTHAIRNQKLEIYNVGGRFSFRVYSYTPSQALADSGNWVDNYLIISGDTYRFRLNIGRYAQILSIQFFRNNIQIYSASEFTNTWGINLSMDLSNGVKLYREGNLIYNDGSSGVKILERMENVTTDHSSTPGAISFSEFRTIGGNNLIQSGFEFQQIALPGSATAWSDFLGNVYQPAGSPSINFRITQNGVNSQLTLGKNLTGNTPVIIGFINSNTKGNNVSFSDLQLRYFQVANIPLDVLNMTNLSVLEALEELAAMCMYQIGFNTDDKFFFTQRTSTGATKELTDKHVLAMTQIQQDIDRLATRVVVGYGNFNKAVDANSEGEPHPNNIDTYGLRLYKISGKQLLPANNVDLAFAVAPTVYKELSVLRLKVEIDIIFDIELELGDFVRVLHNNNLFARSDFTDYIKYKNLGTFFMRCRIEGIKSNFKTRRTTLTLIDFTSPDEIPPE